MCWYEVSTWAQEKDSAVNVPYMFRTHTVLYKYMEQTNLLYISCETRWLLCQHCWCERSMCHGTVAGCKVRVVPTRSAYSLHFTANSPSLLFHVWCQREPCLWFDACFIEQMFLQGSLWSQHVAPIKMAEGMEPALITTWCCFDVEAVIPIPITPSVQLSC